MFRPIVRIVLSSPHVTLAPLTMAHAAGLAAAVRDGEIWRNPYTWVPHPDAVAGEIKRRLDLQALGEWLPFAVLSPQGVPVGMTNYLQIDAQTPRLEIGGTWYAQSVQGTAINPAAKWLLLDHAFTTLGCVAVELRAHHRNARSRRAIERLGARLDGILRDQARMPDGSLRDTAVYSILAAEWPEVDALLTARLAAHAS